MDKTMIVGLHLNDFKLLSNITRKIRSKEFTLRHIENLPKKSDQIDVVISEKRLKNCPIPQIQPQNLDIIELRIRLPRFKPFILWAAQSDEISSQLIPQTFSV